MIRNVVVGRVRDGVPTEQVETAIQALRDLTVEGVDFRLVGGQDRGLRDGNAHYALTADFVSDEAYRVYDADPEHNRIRRELLRRSRSRSSASSSPCPTENPSRVGAPGS